MSTQQQFILETLSPVSHHDTLTGTDNRTNVRLFMRQAAVVNGIPTRIPALSENALRTSLFRWPLHSYLVERLGIAGQLRPAVNTLLFSGGNMLGGSKAPGDEKELGHQVKALYPSLDLLGGAVDGFILPRSRLKITAWIVCREYARAIRFLNPELASEAEATSIYDLVMDETRTRGTGEGAEGNQMLYSYETLAAGAKILVELSFDRHTPAATIAAASAALFAWDGYFGGQNRQGRGRMMFTQSPRTDPAAYYRHMEDNLDRIKQGLLDGTFGTAKELCA